ncbi:MAG TPA: hypothetical protein PLU16_03215 [Gallionellaceae bacterium]|nr:hypothetical protein [Gallionellaceae bacterium]HQS74194.1 hypothetical protein [Gallionellaceae bacterium]
MASIGILAYGSLIDDPGIEIQPLIVEQRAGVETPFRIEFARSSSTRNGAPTVIPVENGGSSVLASILVLDKVVSLVAAEDLLWRRETRNECSESHYKRATKPNLNKVVVKLLHDLGGLDLVIYTSLGPNIEDLSPTKLADLAVSSARAKAGKEGTDGISYLLSLKRQGIATPLAPAYESEILRLTKTLTLESALAKCQGKGV